MLSVPDTRGRYYLLALLGGWSNVVASIGKRTTGTEKRDFAIVGPRYKGKLPDDVTPIKSPTEIAWLFGRTAVDSRKDLKAAIKVQEQYKLTPLAQWGKRTKPSKDKAADKAPTAPAVEPRDVVAKMDAATFFTRFAKLLPGNPPTKEDEPMVGKIKALGLVEGQPFDVAKLDAVEARSVEQGAQAAREAIAGGAGRNTDSDIKHGWSYDRALGRWGVDYGRRAVAAAKGLGVNAPEDAIFMTARFDGAGKRFDGAQRYVLHFDKGQQPPTEGFWSLSAYDDKQHFVPNALDRFNLGSTDNLKRNADGSLDVYVQSESPGKDKEANWLPAPKGPFILMLRIYWPDQKIIDGTWAPPGVKQLT